MPLESYPVYISQLDETSPDGATEYVSEGDDHLRGLKSSLKQQFPSLGAVAMNVPAATLNKVLTSIVADLLDDTTAAAARTTLGVTTATANTASTVVQRDGSGNFAAGTITATLSGNASTATSATSATTATNCSRSVIAGSGLNGGGALTANRTINMDSAQLMTTANVLAMTAAMTAGAVGSISFLRPSSGAKANPNTLVSGWYYSDGVNYLGGLAGGSWRSLAENNGSTGATLFVRYA